MYYLGVVQRHVSVSVEIVRSPAAIVSNTAATTDGTFTLTPKMELNTRMLTKVSQDRTF